MFEDCITRMPGIPLVTRETIYSRTADLMCRQESRVHLSAEEETAAEESLSTYCKPVELYNILQRRAINNPSFLQRCLLYKLQAKHKRRIQMKISLTGTVNDSLKTQSLFPLYILLARPISDSAFSEVHSDVYHYTRACTLNASSVFEGRNRAVANFILPEINKLGGEVKSGSFAILFVSHEKVGGHCFLGKLQMDSLFVSWENSPRFSLGQKAEMMSTVDLLPCFMKPSCLREDKCVSFQSAYSPGTLGKQIQVIISAEELGAKEKSPYNSYTYNDISTSSMPQIFRLRLGNVIFNYRYYNNKLQRTEVTEDFSCPFCLVKCASFKGLRYHLSSSHDLFNFEFWVTEEYQAVNVSVKTDFWKTECVVAGVDPKQETFSFCSKPLRRRKPKKILPRSKYVCPLEFDSNLTAAADAHSSQGGKALLSNAELQNAKLGAADCVEHVASSANVTGVSIDAAHQYVDPECVQSLSEGNLAPPAMLQFAKTRKLSVERSDPRNRALLQRRQFFHSHRAQPMAVEQVLSDQDSEDEVDDDVADFEDRRIKRSKRESRKRTRIIKFRKPY